MILLLGGNGYVGRAFQRHLAAWDEPFRVLSRSEADYYDPRTLERVIRESGARHLINAAGYTGKPNVDACEVHRADCLAGNAVLPGVVREACEAADIPWGHVSSGCIYSGRRSDGGGFTEEDPPNFCFRTDNCSFYSGSKALGEEVLQGAERCYVWRMRIPFDHRDGPRNFLSKLLRYERLLDAENSITHLAEFAEASTRTLLDKIPYGIYHVTNTGSVRTREVVDLLRDHLGIEKEFRFFGSEEEFMRIAARTPRSNCLLDNSKLLETGIGMTPVRSAIRRSLEQWERAAAT